jgi:hypothetical protein
MASTTVVHGLERAFAPDKRSPVSTGNRPPDHRQAPRLQHVRVPRTVADLGIDPEAFRSAIDDLAMAAFRDSSLRTNRAWRSSPSSGSCWAPWPAIYENHDTQPEATMPTTTPAKHARRAPASTTRSTWATPGARIRRSSRP